MATMRATLRGPGGEGRHGGEDPRLMTPQSNPAAGSSRVKRSILMVLAAR